MDINTCPELDLAEWGAVIANQLGKARYPFKGMFELTDRCNMNCVHCYINQPANSRIAKSRELDTKQVLGIFDQLAEAGCLFLTLTGGEPLLRPDFPEIYSYARRKGFLISLFTNGALVTPAIADLLADIPPYSIEVTLYGATPETYEKVTRIPGSYSRCIQGVRLLLERNLPVHLKSMVLTLNRHELADMKKFAEDLGDKFRFDAMLIPRLDGDRGPLQFQLSLQELIDLDLEDTQRLQDWKQAVETHQPVKVRSEFVFGCGAGLRNFHIDSAGHVSVCTIVRKPAYDLTKVSFEDAWDRLGAERQRKLQLATPCITCELDALCLQCTGWSQLVHGDDETPVEFICNLAKQRLEQIQKL